MQNKRTLVDIVICVYNRFDLLQQCIDSIPAAVDGGFEYNLILVDNGSEKMTAKSFYHSLDDSNLTVIYNNKNLGFPSASNRGAARKSSPLIFMLNSDVILMPGSLNLLVKDMDDPKIAVAGMKLLFPGDVSDRGLNHYIRPSGKVQHVGITTNIAGELFHIFSGWDSDHPKVNAVRDVYMVTGATMLIRRSVWTQIGGFFLGYGLGTYEDAELCVSARKMGYNIVVNTDAVALHYVGATAETYQIAYPINSNKVLFLQRNGGALVWDEYKYW